MFTAELASHTPPKPAIPRTRVFDGHNDVLSRLRSERGGYQSFLSGTRGHLDAPRAMRGGFGGGFFAIWVSGSAVALEDRIQERPGGWQIPPLPSIAMHAAQAEAWAQISMLLRLERESAGTLEVVRDPSALAPALRDGRIGAVMHLEGAEPLDPDRGDLLEVLYGAGLRSLGIAWSRANAFGHGVPFAFPSSPDTGPGLTAAGVRLVDACNELGVMIDLSHLNERGFWDVAERSNAPLVATHSGAHALTPLSRNLTDDQLAAIGSSEGVIGINFGVADIRPDGRHDPDTPLADIARHVEYVADRIGINHVAFGSDFDGAVIPDELGDVSGLPRLLDCLRTRGFDDASLRKLAHENWFRVLAATWRTQAGNT